MCTSAVTIVVVGSVGAHNVLSVGMPPVAETSSVDAISEMAMSVPVRLVSVLRAVSSAKGMYMPHPTGEVDGSPIFDHTAPVSAVGSTSGVVGVSPCCGL